MNRKTIPYQQMIVDAGGKIIENPIQFHGGSDHAIGRFMDITDSRYAKSGKDEQGEGYVFEYSELFGITTNLIGATEDDLFDIDKLAQLTEIFVAQNQRR